jgi:hypothetical protein
LDFLNLSPFIERFVKRRTQFMGSNEIYEMESMLHDVWHQGFGVIMLAKIYRLLEKGNRAAGTWKALLDVWESIGHQRAELHMAELPGEKILLTTVKTEYVSKRAGEGIPRLRLHDSSRQA